MTNFSSIDVTIAFASASKRCDGCGFVTRKEIFYNFKDILSSHAIAHTDSDVRNAKMVLGL